MAAQLQLASTSWQPTIQTAHQSARSANEQPVEAPQLALSANNFVIRWLADKHQEDWIEVSSAIARATYGYDTSKIYERLARAHDYLFSEAEAYGERHGRKLGTKMGSATNFCDTDMIAGDEITRKLLEDDDEIAKHAGNVYVSFCRLMERLRVKRLALIQADNQEMDFGEAINLSTEFMLSMKAKYHGEQIAQTGESIARMMSVSISRIVESKSSK